MLNSTMKKQATSQTTNKNGDSGKLNKRNAILLHTTKQINLENIELSERGILKERSTHKTMYYMIPLT